MKQLAILTFLATFAYAPSALAQKPSFIMPIDCTLDEDCWVVNYVDMNPGEKAEDFRCGPKTYDAHKGTDFALRSRKEMKDGVNVLAARAGTVERFRDGENDDVKSAADIETIKELQKECGNGIYIDHGSAIKTVYCHMKEGSIKVAIGDKVEAGDIIGQVGQSGMAEFPHLHFGILWENGVMDPYTGLTNTDGCGGHKQSLWKNPDDMFYSPVSIYDGGFDIQAPDFKAIEEGQEQSSKITADPEKAFLFWAAFYGVQEGDQITMRITDELGRQFASRNITQDKTRARQYYFVGRPLKGRELPIGKYIGTVTLEREGMAKREKVFGAKVID